MNDTYQGSIGSVSPAMGPYKLEVYIDVDRGSTGASGVTGNETLIPYDWDISVTGISSSNFTNAKHGF